MPRNKPVTTLSEPYWSLQKGESQRAFLAFRLYRDCEDNNPPIKRSKQMVATRLSKSINLINRWARLWRWDERILAYDRRKDSEGPSNQGRQFLRFLGSFYDVYKRIGRERPTQEEMAIAWRLEDASSLRKKMRQNSISGFKLNHRMLTGYCRFRKWTEDRRSPESSAIEFDITAREIPDYLWFAICLERVCLGLPIATSSI